MGEETPPEERGKILGLMEPTTNVVNSLDYGLTRGARDFNENGSYRWPFGLELRAAWRFVEPRAKLEDITSRRFGMDAALGIVPLTSEEASRVLKLNREAIPLLRSVRAAIAVEGEKARKKAAPPPTTRRAGVMHLRKAPAYTYAMEIIGANEVAFKIGWAFDHKVRARQFNLSSLPQLGGLRYRIIFEHLWETARSAFAMEQALLRDFDALRHPANREVLAPLTRETLWNAWMTYLIKLRVAT